jgi:hypothetical protein
MEEQQRERQRLDMRFVVKAGARPQPDQARRALEALLQERLRMTEEERQRAMQHVQRVLVLPGRRGAGYTLLATFDSEAAKQQVYSRRHSWRSSSGEGPALTIGHNLTSEQQELHGLFFPIMAGIYGQGVPVRMEYYPAVCMYVAGRQCHTAAEAEEAAATYLRGQQRGRRAGGGSGGTAAGAGAAAVGSGRAEGKAAGCSAAGGSNSGGGGGGGGGGSSGGSGGRGRSRSRGGSGSQRGGSGRPGPRPDRGPAAGPQAAAAADAAC